MGNVVPLPRRELFVDARGSALRTSWHSDSGVAVVSVWHGDTCVGSVRLAPDEVARMVQFLVGHLGDMAAAERPASQSGS